MGEETDVPSGEELLLKQVTETKNSLSTDRLDMSFGEIMSMYERDEIIIDPEFQRLFRWSNEQQTRFIESLLLGIPIPPIFVAEDKNGKWEVVDGLQRISTVISFFGLLKTMTEKNKWNLSEGDLVKSLENYNVESFPLKLNLNIKRAVCRIEIIKWNSKMDMRFELFNRLNTGGSPLTDQEIRNCIFRGTSVEFNNFLKKISRKGRFIELINPTSKQSEEKYLEELVLRFASLVHDWNKVNESLSRYMTNYMKIAVANKDFDFVGLEKLFDRTINLLNPHGPDVFRGINGVFSSSLYDAITIGVALNIDYYEKTDSKELTERITKLKNSEDFRKYSGTASNSKYRVIGRIKVATEIFKAR
ncbi:MAG: DUF262 domain-containing protein [Candidatus Methanoperedens sp.]